MSVSLACDQCGLTDGGDRGVLYALGHVTAERNSLHISVYEYPTLLHWGCIASYVAARDLTDKEPPF